MIKLRTVIILFLIYIIAFLSITYDLNILTPYYFLKDIILLPVNALSQDNVISLSNNMQESIISSLKDEIKSLQEINQLGHVLTDFKYVNATVILRNREYWFNNITLDKGKKDGVKVNQAVIDSNGLIGRISNVREFTSDVKLITTNDVTSKISAVIKRDKKIYGIISGYDTKLNLLKMTINEKMDIYEKEKVETTGLGGIFPEGILIGNVFDMITSNDDSSITVRIKPSSNIESEKYVSILQREEISNN